MTLRPAPRPEGKWNLGESSLAPGSPVRVRLVKAVHPDVEYDAVVIVDDGVHIVVRAPWAEAEARDLGFVRFEPGDVFTEHYWRDRWYSIKEVRDEGGLLKGRYCDVARPVRIEDGLLISEDLDLDLWVSADGLTVLRLDEDEFAARGLMATDPVAATQALDALAELERLARSGFAGIGLQTPVASRQAVRVLLFDEADRVLLVRFWDGDQSWWCTPGGGIEPGETDEAAALREIREELGNESVELSACIWTRRHIGVFRGRPFDQSERIYLGRVAAFEPRPTPMALREHGPDDLRWWTLDRLTEASDEFSPRRLPTLARDIVQAGAPERPIDVGV